MKVKELNKIGTQFTQFIIAVNGALIVYATQRAYDFDLRFVSVPLGFAVIFWGLSFYYGVSSIRKLISTRTIGISMKDEFHGTMPDYKEIAEKKISEIEKKSNIYNKNMYTFLYLGGFSYIFWQLLEMYLKTLKY